MMSATRGHWVPSRGTCREPVQMVRKHQQAHCYLREAVMGTGDREAGAKTEREIEQRGKRYSCSLKQGWKGPT